MVRLKTRYLMVEVIWHQEVLEDGTVRPTLSLSWIHNWIEQKSRELIGALTTQAYIKSLKIIYCNSITNTMILRCNFEQYRNLWTVLSMITECCGFLTYFRVLHVGGSLKSCQKSVLKEYGKPLLVKSFDPLVAMNELYNINSSSSISSGNIDNQQSQQQGIELNLTESDNEDDGFDDRDNNDDDDLINSNNDNNNNINNHDESIDSMDTNNDKQKPKQQQSKQPPKQQQSKQQPSSQQKQQKPKQQVKETKKK
ncbi:RNase P protein subunit [Heterostelium album PN500]|uniref:RNase P protein subunit n=1 Tax=Heterostelium pallidum (strain ATCC 26659 / Pp 5 / PN500) TaxID=670386 RepID=D3B6V1_HETP5|nr:RNase P protein subunit [Heterostelium album PN500]EFA83071.1 RNase P protein subunit [Heterostelium album PN500]|eukprot:XP_020435188.1 RNase P protein subunit [Heterostelium album PN500]